MLRINDVVQLEEERYRVLTISGKFVIWIDINSAKAFPKVVTTSNVDQWMLDEALRRADDPFSYLTSVSVHQGTDPTPEFRSI